MESKNNSTPLPTKKNFNKLSCDLKYRTLDEVCSQNRMGRKIAKKYNLPTVTVSKWVKRVKDNRRLNNSSGGRPRILDATYLRILLMWPVILV